MAKFDVSVIQSMIETLYTDTMDVYRETEAATEYGDIERTRTQVYSNIECRADPWLIDDKPDTADFAENRQLLEVLIFCNPAYVLKKGDYLEIKRLDGAGNELTKFAGYSNAPQIYPSHQELKIVVKDDKTLGF